MAMKVLYVTNAYGGILGVRTLDLNVGSVPFQVADERTGGSEYRGQAYVEGILVVEDAWTATTLVTADPIDNQFDVVTGTGGFTGSITIRGFKAFEYHVLVPDGVRGGRVPGYAVRFRGILEGAYTAMTAAYHAQA